MQMDRLVCTDAMALDGTTDMSKKARRSISEPGDFRIYGAGAREREAQSGPGLCSSRAWSTK